MIRTSCNFIPKQFVFDICLQQQTFYELLPSSRVPQAIGVKDLVILSDPQMLILPQNVTPLVSASLPAIAATAINRVSALLTPDELRSLNQRSTGEKLSSKVIATDWLNSKKLL